jgi:hypothetical protein
VDPKTINHLRIAERNRELARALLDPSQASLRPTPWEWVAVIAFYAAVHLVNAYLWETRGLVPSSHAHRRRELQAALRISACRQSYSALNLAGYQARYDETYSLTEQDARTLLEIHFRRVEATVMQALGQPVPVW